jgi:hypothetical protein
MYALGVPQGYRPYDVFYATENRYMNFQTDYVIPIPFSDATL